MTSVSLKQRFKKYKSTSAVYTPSRLNLEGSIEGKQTQYRKTSTDRLQSTSRATSILNVPPIYLCGSSHLIEPSNSQLSQSHSNVLRNVLSNSPNTSTSTILQAGTSFYSVTNTTSMQDVLMNGSLVKRGHFIKNWLVRYFVLTRSSLSYYRKNPLCTTSTSFHRWRRGEILRGDVVRIETTDRFLHRPYCFLLLVRKPARYLFVHHKERRFKTCKGKQSRTEERDDRNGSLTLYYFQARDEEERDRWIKALQRWIDGEPLPTIGRAIVEYIVSNEYSTYKYDQKVGTVENWPPIQEASPAVQEGRKIEEEHCVLANLIRDMMDCTVEDEMVFILDQILGEIREETSTTGMNAATCNGNIKKMIAAAGEMKLEKTPSVWTSHVQAAYARIMKSLHTERHSSIVYNRSNSVCSTPYHPSTTGSLKPTVLAPTRQLSDGGESAPEFSFHRLYKLGRKLGSGANSVVHIATHRETRKQFAVKCIAKSNMLESDVDALKHEVEIMSTLNHPNVVPLLDYFEETRYYYIVTPLCTGGELFDDLVKRKTYTEEDARSLLRKLASAIEYVHSRGIVHRDLKPENILLKTSAPGAEVIIADFGFARTTRGEKRWTACGTPGYVAPEIVRGESYGSEVDCWSLGVILFILLCGYPPFPGKNHIEIFEKVLIAKYTFTSPDWDLVSESAKDLVRQLLTPNRSKRLTAAGILAHPWMNTTSAHIETAEPQMLRKMSDLRPALTHMRNGSLTNVIPKISGSDINVDATVLQLSHISIEDDVELLDRELANLEGF